MITKRLKKRFLQEMSYATGKYLLSPEIVSLAITYQCNFRCNSCTVWRMDKYPELSQEQWHTVIEQLKTSLSNETSIELSGGEPLLRKDLVCSLIKQLSSFFKHVGINSNGSLLDRETILALKESGITFAKVSLYDIQNNVHDALRGVADATLQAKNAIELLQQQKIQTTIGALITAKNISGIPNLIRYYSKSKYSNLDIVLQPLDEPIGLSPVIGKNKTATIENLWPSKQALDELFFWLEKNNSKKIKNSAASLATIKQFYLDHQSVLKRRCLAGQRSLVIYPDGNLALCYKGKIIGNMAKDNLYEILIAEHTKQARLAIKKCNRHCRIIGCNFSKTIPEILKFN